MQNYHRLFINLISFSLVSTVAALFMLQTVAAENYWYNEITPASIVGYPTKTSDGGFIVPASYTNSLGMFKINSSGGIDTSFGTNGEVSFGAASTSWSATRAKQISSGGYVLLGSNSSYYESYTTGLMIKTLSNGSPDTSFGTNGVVTVGQSAKTVVLEDAIETTDHKFIVVGNWSQTSPSSDSRCFISKINANGTLDTTFATNGVLTVRATDASTSQNWCQSIVMTTDGNYVVVGNSQVFIADAFALKINSSGQIVTSFGNNAGYFIGNAGGAATFTRAAKATSDGGVIIAGNTSNSAVVVKLTAAGLPDTGFGAGNKGAQEFQVSKYSGEGNYSAFFDIFQLADGSYLATGTTEYTSNGSNDPYGIAVKITAAGRLDTSFNGNGALEFGAASSYSSYSIFGVQQQSSNDYTFFGRYMTSTTVGKLITVKVNLNGDLSGCSNFRTMVVSEGKNTLSTRTSALTTYSDITYTVENALPSYTLKSYAASQSCSLSTGSNIVPPATGLGLKVTDGNFGSEVASGVEGKTTLGIVNGSTNAPIALINVDTSLIGGGTIDWSGLQGGSTGGKSYLHYSYGFASLPAQSGNSFILFVAKEDGTQVRICPEAAGLDDVNLTCHAGYYLDETSPNVSVVSVSGIAYWRVTGLTGTGGMSVISGIRDSMTRLAANSPSNHTISFGTNYGLAAGSNSTIELSLPGFDLSWISISDITLADSSASIHSLAAAAGPGVWGVSIDSVNDIITFSVPTSGTGGFPEASEIIIFIGTNSGGGSANIINPVIAGTYHIYTSLHNNHEEQASIAIPIVDNDQVNITGYVNTFIDFDIDLATSDVDCNYNTCLTHSGGTAASNYTLDLGELNSGWVNKSQSNILLHADGNSGYINAVYFDLTTNAYSGAVIAVTSENGCLQGPDTSTIASVADGADINANSGAYGYQVLNMSTNSGTITANILCDATHKFCGLTKSGSTVFNTSGAPVDGARVRMDVAAAASYTNSPGTYSDTMKFVVTATY